MKRSTPTHPQPAQAPPPPPPQLVDRRGLAQHIGVHPETVNRMVRRGCPYFDVAASAGRYRRMRFDVAAVLAWMSARAREVRS